MHHLALINTPGEQEDENSTIDSNYCGLTDLKVRYSSRDCTLINRSGGVILKNYPGNNDKLKLGT